MNYDSYIQTRNAIISSYEKHFSFENNENLTGQFNMVSASLSNFLPEIPFSQHKDIYKNILLHKKLSILEQSSHSVLDFVKKENHSVELQNLIRTRPSIVCTFHTGSYRIINLFLAINKIPFTLVTGKDIMEKEGETFLTHFKEITGNTIDSFKIIDAENAIAGMQMLRELKKGRTLVLYMDGNTGAGTVTNHNLNNHAVDFLHQKIFARKGIAYLAHIANVPVIPVASYRNSMEDIRLRFFDPIYPDKRKHPDEFAKETTQEIYDLVTPLIKKFPEQWEGWLYLHKVASIVNLNAEFRHANEQYSCCEKVRFNSRLFGIFKLGNVSLLLNKSAYSFYEVDSSLYEILTRCVEVPLKKECFNANVFRQLYEEGVLVPS